MTTDAAIRSVSTIARQALAMEAGVWRSLYRWLSGRSPVSEGAMTFGYSRTVAPVFWAFIGVSAIDIPVLHLILPWRTAQIVALILGIWG